MTQLRTSLTDRISSKDTQGEFFVYAPTKRVITCIDEGIDLTNPDALNLQGIDSNDRVVGVHWAGSGILCDDHVRQVQRPIFKDLDGITSHCECGAANLSLSTQPRRAECECDSWAITNAQQHGPDLGIAYLGHIRSLKRPAGHHPATHIVYDTTGHFRLPGDLEGDERAFVISRGWLGEELAMKDLSLALKIMFGKHGANPNKATIVLTIDSDAKMKAVTTFHAEIETVCRRKKLDGIISCKTARIFDLP